MLKNIVRYKYKFTLDDAGLQKFEKRMTPDDKNLIKFEKRMTLAYKKMTKFVKRMTPDDTICKLLFCFEWIFKYLFVFANCVIRCKFAREGGVFISKNLKF